jgi:D-alanine-D-alanine ligase
MKTIGIICGGKSAEHEVSLISAQNVLKELPRDLYRAVVLGIDKQGGWWLYADNNAFVNSDDAKRISLSRTGQKITLELKGQIISLADGKELDKVDVIFPVLHGSYGEDGTMQGLLRILDIPFVGPDVLASAACMDKDITKKLLVANGLPIVPYKIALTEKEALENFTTYVNDLGLPFFIKPANQGSSVGIHKVKDETSFKNAVRDAFDFDKKILIEKYIAGREIECAVLGNEEPRASTLGEIIPQHEFYSYEAKYLDDQGAILVAPAEIDELLAKKIQSLAINAFQALGCEGMARVDFFLAGEDMYINEINTIPGFTKISMYPRLWQLSGLEYPKLLQKLIELALIKYERQQKLNTSYN